MMNTNTKSSNSTSRRMCVTAVLVLLLPVAVVDSFELAKVFTGVATGKPPSFLNINNNNNNNNKNNGKIQTAKAQLLELIADTGSGKDADPRIQSEVLSLVSYLERNAPVSKTLLTNPAESKLINGDWFLKYTQPSEPEGVDLDAADADALAKWEPAESTLEDVKKLDTRRANNEGSVSFLGLVKVDTSKAKRTIQTIDTETSVFRNAVEKDFGTIAVEGYFELDSVPNRIIAAFESGSLTLENGFVIDFSFLFAVRAFLKGGMKAGGWLETTYLDETMRISRGNRGSLFVLTRD